jgi:adenine-specific DNA-methyltransferase
MIYIDPPYNTGNDFVYKDNFRQPIKNYLEQSGQVDSEGNHLSTNTQASGRFHSDWLNMMYPRLKLAWNLLRHDGVIFVSIDDNEVHHLRVIIDEVFGAENFLAQLVWNQKSGSQAGHFTGSHEYVLSYCRSKEGLPYFSDKSGGIIEHGALKKISRANPAK